MYTKNNLMEHLSELKINPTGTLMIHVSLKAIGKTENRADTVLDAFMEYMKQGLLVLASHTWDNVNDENPVMDVLFTPTCVGVLTELFRKRQGVHRSLHPTHSVAAFGKDAEDFIGGEEKINTPCGKGGAYYRLWERNAQILLIGVNFTSNTFIHGLEEWENSKGAISDTKTDFYVIDKEGKRLYTPQYKHCAPLGSSTFTNLEPGLINEGIVTLGRFGDATTRLMEAKPVREYVGKILKQNPEYLLKF